MTGRVRIGTSGWNYPHWRRRFYPDGLPVQAWLRHAAAAFDALEINTTFYGSARPSTFTRWREEIADLARARGFRFSVKGSRYITHMLKLRDVEQAVANFFATGPLLLGAALGPILWQLPPQLAFDRERLERFLGGLPRDAAAAQRLARRHDARFTHRATDERGPGLAAGARLHYAIEPRHPSFDSDAFLEVCRRHRVAAVAADLVGCEVALRTVTASLAYARLHGSRRKYASRYTDRELSGWAARIAAWRDEGARDVYVFFDNDFQAHAARDALRLRRLLDAGAAAGAAAHGSTGR